MTAGKNDSIKSWFSDPHTEYSIRTALSRIELVPLMMSAIGAQGYGENTDTKPIIGIVAQPTIKCLISPLIRTKSRQIVALDDCVLHVHNVSEFIMSYQHITQQEMMRSELVAYLDTPVWKERFVDRILALDTSVYLRNSAITRLQDIRGYHPEQHTNARSWLKFLAAQPLTQQTKLSEINAYKTAPGDDKLPTNVIAPNSASHQMLRGLTAEMVEDLKMLNWNWSV